MSLSYILKLLNHDYSNFHCHYFFCFFPFYRIMPIETKKSFHDSESFSIIIKLLVSDSISERIDSANQIVQKLIFQGLLYDQDEQH